MDCTFWITVWFGIGMLCSVSLGVAETSGQRALAQASWRLIGDAVYGAEADESGPLGGGAGYGRIPPGGGLRVRTVEELLEALAGAQAGEVVFVNGNAELDLTEWVFADATVLRIPAGVTLASNRGHEGSPGALLKSEAMGTSPLIEVLGPGVRITGLRLRGPDPQRRLAFHYRVFAVQPGTPEEQNANYYKLPTACAIIADDDRLEVDNCEISAWSNTGVYLRKGRGHRIHHCFIHHCQRMGLGYGITHGEAESLIEFNVFQDNKHHIAGTGAPGSGYEARHNVVLPYTESHAHPVTGEPYGQDHIFDMHGGRDRSDGTEIAGAWLRIHHNTVYPGYLTVNIRGVPEQSADIHHNWLVGHQPGSVVVETSGRTRVHDNLYGEKGILMPLVGACEALSPVSLRDGEPGMARMRVRNTGPLPVRGALSLQGLPLGCSTINEGRPLPLALAPDEEGTWDVAVRLDPDVPPPARVTVSPAPGGELVVLDDTGLRVPSADVAVRGHPIRTLEQQDDLTAAAAQLEALAEGPTQLSAGGARVASIRYAVSGGALLVSAQVCDRQITRDATVWKASCVEVFAAPAYEAKHVQVFLVPAAQAEPAAALVAEGSAFVPLEGATVQSQATTDGYRITGQIPLPLLGIGAAAREFVMELQAGAVTAPGEARRYAKRFDAPAPYAGTEGYGHFSLK